MNRDEFESALDANPDDWDTRRLYADWLEENGDPFAECQRWMADNERRAEEASHTFDWWHETSHHWKNSRVPKEAWRHMPQGIDHQGEDQMIDYHDWDYHEYPTRQAAERALATALAECGITGAIA